MFIQMCSDPTPMHCWTSQGKVHSLLFSAPLQNRLTAGLCHCNDTYGHLLFKKVCSDPTTMHCLTSKGEVHSLLFSASLQNRLTGGLCHCHDTYRHLLFKNICSDPKKPMHCSSGFSKVKSQLFCAALQNRLTAGFFTAFTPMKICCLCRCAVTLHQCIAALVLAKRIPSIMCCSAKEAHSRQPLKLHRLR